MKGTSERKEKGIESKREMVGGRKGEVLEIHRGVARYRGKELLVQSQRRGGWRQN